MGALSSVNPVSQMSFVAHVLTWPTLLKWINDRPKPQHIPCESCFRLFPVCLLYRDITIDTQHLARCICSMVESILLFKESRLFCSELSLLKNLTFGIVWTEAYFSMDRISFFYWEMFVVYLKSLLSLSSKQFDTCFKLNGSFWWLNVIGPVGVKVRKHVT